MRDTQLIDNVKENSYSFNSKKIHLGPCITKTKTKKNRYDKDRDKDKDNDKEEQVKSEMCVNRSHSEKASVGPIPRIAGDSENGGRRTCFNLNFSFSSLTGNLKKK